MRRRRLTVTVVDDRPALAEMSAEAYNEETRSILDEARKWAYEMRGNFGYYAEPPLDRHYSATKHSRPDLAPLVWDILQAARRAMHPPEPPRVSILDRILNAPQD